MDRGSRAAARREARLPAGRKGALLALLSVPLAAGFRLIPYSSRVRAVLRVAIPIAFVARAFGYGPRMGGLDVRERVIGRVLSMLHYRSVAYPAEISVVSAARLAGPLLLLVRHSLLNQLLISRLVHDGLPVTLVMSHLAGHVRAFGGDRILDVLEPSVMVMRAVANRLDAGCIVIVAIDATEPVPGFTRVETPAGPWFLATQSIRLAIKRGIPVAVLVHDIQGATVISHIRCIPHTDVERVIGGYCEAYGVRRAW